MASSGFAADWSPKLAAAYLDARQKAWESWDTAHTANGACVSCHTGMTYLLARPALRRVLGEKNPTEWETKILDHMTASAGKEPAGQLQGVETIFKALFVEDADASKRAFEQLSSLQIRNGDLKGAFPWYSVNLDPWETPSSLFYGAALGAMAIGKASAPFEGTAELRAYLHTRLADRPLHSRLALLWASTALKDIVSETERDSIVRETLEKQSPDGSWTVASLGPWQAHPDAPARPGGDSYATGFSSYVLLKAGVAASNARLEKSLAWLKARQDSSTGAWAAVSMNKTYPKGSMQESFQQDAATAFAVLALVEARR